MNVAHSFEIARCGNPECRSIHLFLLNDHEKRFACAAIIANDVPDITKVLQDIAYEIATEKEGP